MRGCLGFKSSLIMHQTCKNDWIIVADKKSYYFC